MREGDDVPSHGDLPVFLCGFEHTQLCRDSRAESVRNRTVLRRYPHVQTEPVDNEHKSACDILRAEQSSVVAPFIRHHVVQPNSAFHNPQQTSPKPISPRDTRVPVRWSVSFIGQLPPEIAAHSRLVIRDRSARR